MVPVYCVCMYMDILQEMSVPAPVPALNKLYMYSNSLNFWDQLTTAMKTTKQNYKI